MKYVLGVDAGNTKTIALISKLNGEIVGSGRGGCGDIYNTTAPAVAVQNVDHAVQAALRSAGLNESQIVSTAFSMAGADWPEDFALIKAAFLSKGYCAQFTLVNDAVGALRAGALDDWGVSIANGTGAAICARNLHGGKSFEMSWWQEGGGGRSLGYSGLRAVYRAELGIDAPTALTEPILAFCGKSSVEGLLHLFTRREEPALKMVPSLARIILDVAKEGDAVAREIVRADGVLLADYALAAARKVGIAYQQFPLILAGSIFKHDSSLLVDTILERVRSKSPGTSLLKSQLEPVAGALVIALEAVGIKSSRKIRARLEATKPHVDLFVT